MTLISVPGGGVVALAVALPRPWFEAVFGLLMLVLLAGLLFLAWRWPGDRD